MKTSVIIPAYKAQDCLLRALMSLCAQTVEAWEAVIVSDDGFDYAPLVRAAGMDDARLRFVSTGQNGSGCHNARNVGLRHITGDALSWLDADDAWLPGRLETLLPLAQRFGAAADLLECIDEASGQPLPGQIFAEPSLKLLDLQAFMGFDQPLVPLLLREHVQDRVAGVEMAEDVIANIRLIDRIGQLPLWSQPLYRYYIRPTSLAHTAEAETRFDRAYADYIARLDHGDGFGLSPEARAKALAGFTRKRALNQAYGEARRTQPDLSFQDFVASVPPR